MTKTLWQPYRHPFREPVYGLFKGNPLKERSPPDKIGALLIRIGFWGPLYYNYNKEPPKIELVIV